MTTNAAQYASRAIAHEDAGEYDAAQYYFTRAAIVEDRPKAKAAWQRNADECLALAKAAR